MTTTDYLESLQDDLSRTVEALNLEEGTNFTDIADMAENGEISTGGGADLSEYLLSTPEQWRNNYPAPCSMLIKLPDDFTIPSNYELNYLFAGCEKLTSIPTMGTPTSNSLDHTFYKCKSLLTLPTINTSNIVRFDYAFADCEKLTSISGINTSKATILKHMCENCKALTEIPSLDFTKAIEAEYMFNGCINVTTLPNSFTFPNLEKGTGLFRNCKKITAFSSLSFSKLENMEQMFEYCTALTTIPIIDTSKIIIMTNAFANCPNLSNTSLNNILQMCINATHYNSTSNKTKTLKEIGLSKSQAIACMELSNYSAFENAGWTIGYSLDPNFLNIDKAQTYEEEYNGFGTAYITDNNEYAQYSAQFSDERYKISITIYDEQQEPIGYRGIYFDNNGSGYQFSYIENDSMELPIVENLFTNFFTENDDDLSYIVNLNNQDYTFEFVDDLSNTRFNVPE